MILIFNVKEPQEEQRARMRERLARRDQAEVLDALEILGEDPEDYRMTEEQIALQALALCSASGPDQAVRYSPRAYERLIFCLETAQRVIDRQGQIFRRLCYIDTGISGVSPIAQENLAAVKALRLMDADDDPRFEFECWQKEVEVRAEQGVDEAQPYTDVYIGEDGAVELLHRWGRFSDSRDSDLTLRLKGHVSIVS